MGELAFSKMTQTQIQGVSFDRFRPWDSLWEEFAKRLFLVVTKDQL